MKNLTYSEIMAKNRNHSKSSNSKSAYKIAILSNCTVDFAKDILEYVLREAGVHARVYIGNYDSIVQDSYRFATSDAVIIFWELCNLIDGLQYKIELFSDTEIDELCRQICLEVEIVIKNLEKTRLVLINSFSSLPFACSTFQKSKLEKLQIHLNQYLYSRVSGSMYVIPIDEIISKLSLDVSIDWRFFYSAKSLYSIDFYKSYSQHIKSFVLAMNGKMKKALIFDCDNTLWKGVIGEDGPQGIEVSNSSMPGVIFSEIQAMAVNLHKNGVLIGLCSKNNKSDVDNILNLHPDMILRDEFIVIKKINWKDKATNLREISNELGIGLDSIVFVDDSPFEVNLIREQLPDVFVLKVPEKLEEYPHLLRDHLSLFHTLSTSIEDTFRSKMYQDNIERQKLKSQYNNIESYLTSLDLSIEVYEDAIGLAPRISQLTQKTNQFNLTSKRYTESEIENLILNNSFIVYTFSLNDKFGDSGIVGVCIVQLNILKQEAFIDTYLLSCRAIGRDVEFAFMNTLVSLLYDKGIREIRSVYHKTPKNRLIENFYDSCGFSILNYSETFKNYNLDISNYTPMSVNYIKVNYGSKNKKSYVTSI